MSAVGIPAFWYVCYPLNSQLLSFTTKQLLGAIPLRNTPFGRGQFPIILGELFCSGREMSLLECNRNDNSISTCHINQVASLQCEGTYMHYVLLLYSCLEN